MNACYHNAGIEEGGTIDGVFHVTTDTYMHLEDREFVNTKSTWLIWKNGSFMQGLDCGIIV